MQAKKKKDLGPVITK